MKRLFVIAALATFATAAQAEEAAQNSAAASTTTTVAPAAAPTTTVAANGQTSTVIPDPEAAATVGKSWSITLMNQTSVDAADAHYASNGKKNFSALNYAGVGYKLNAKNRIGLRQYFSIDHNGPTGANTTTVNDAVLTYSHSGVAGILNSDALTPSVWYYAPTSDSSRQVSSNGQLRMDLEIPWTLTPKWTVSYYLNPRQNFIPEGVLVNDKGEENPVFSKTTLIHYGYLYYSFSDSVSAYTYGGYMHRMKTTTATLTDQSAMLGLGASFSFLGGKINLNPEVSVASVQVAGAASSAAEEIIQEKNVSYVLSSAFVF
jgi:hypothetical protein